MSSAVRIIKRLVPTLPPMVSVPALPLLITLESSLGSSTSPITSTIMHSGPRMK